MSTQISTDMDYNVSVKRRQRKHKRRRITDEDMEYTFIGCYKHPRRQKEDFSLHVKKFGGVLNACFKRCKESVVGLQKETADEKDTKVGCYCFVDDRSSGNKVRSKRCNRKCNLTDDQSCGGHGKLTSVYSLPGWKPTDQQTTMSNSDSAASTSGRDIGLGVGITAASIVIIALAVVLVRWHIGRRKAQRTKSDGDETYDTIEYHQVGVSGGSDGSCHNRLLNSSCPNGSSESNFKSRRQNTYLGHPRHTSEGSRKSELEKFLKPSEHEGEDEMGYMEPSTSSNKPLYLDIKESPSDSKPFPKRRNPTDEVPDIPLTHAPPPPAVNDIPTTQAPAVPGQIDVTKKQDKSEAKIEKLAEQEGGNEIEDKSSTKQLTSPKVIDSDCGNQGTGDEQISSNIKEDPDENLDDRKRIGDVCQDNSANSVSASNRDESCEESDSCIREVTKVNKGSPTDVTSDHSQTVDVKEAETKSSEA